MTAIANQNIAAAAIGDRVDAGLGPKNPTIRTDRRASLPRDAMESTVSTPQNTGKTPENGKTERFIIGIVLTVLAVVPLLTFLFSFGNVGDLGTSLGIDRRIAYLTGPAVDLTATGMIVAATWLSHRGLTERELWRVHALSIICALIMFALNCGPAIYTHRYQLAGFSAVGPFLLMAMGFVGPWLLRQLTDRQAAPAVDGGTPAPEAAPAAAETPAAAAAMPPAPATGTQAAMPRAAKQGGSDKPRQKKAATAGAAAPNWGDLALPLWQEYVRQHNGEAPTAPVLAGRLRTAYPNLKVPGSPRSERNIRSATEALAAERSASTVKSGQPSNQGGVDS